MIETDPKIMNTLMANCYKCMISCFKTGIIMKTILTFLVLVLGIGVIQGAHTKQTFLIQEESNEVDRNMNVLEDTSFG